MFIDVPIFQIRDSTVRVFYICMTLYNNLLDHYHNLHIPTNCVFILIKLHKREKYVYESSISTHTPPLMSNAPTLLGKQ